MRIVATFESSAFKLPVDGETFAEPPGEDVATWLAARLRAQGCDVMQPVPEDFGWYIGFSLEGHQYQAVIGPEGEEFWYVVVERAVGLLPSLLGLRRRHKNPKAVLMMHQSLQDADIRDVQWHSWSAFSRGGADAFTNGTNSPV
jgi:hypothetical protein